MKLSITARPFSADLRDGLARRWRRALEDLEHPAAAVARALDKGVSLAERWCREDSGHPLPTWVLASVAAVPDALFERVVSDLRAMRGAQRTAPPGAPRPPWRCAATPICSPPATAA